jgi:hypothetical protein
MDRSRHLPPLAASRQGQTENSSRDSPAAWIEVLTALLPSRACRVYRAARSSANQIARLCVCGPRALAAQTVTFKSPGEQARPYGKG